MAKEAVSDDIQAVLENLNLVNDEGKIKKAALLLFGKHPDKFVSAPYFRIGRFRKDDTDLLFQDSVECDLIRMADSVVELLKSKYLISPIHYEGLQRIEDLEIPEDSLREAVFNAIIHKDYAGVHIQMKVWDDRIEIWNDGGLPYDMSIEKLLGQHSSKLRNVNIASVFYKAGFIESWGRGILKIRKGFEDAGIKSPLFEEDCGGVRVTLFRKIEDVTGAKDKSTKRLTAKKEKTRDKVLNLIKENPSITQQEIMDKLSLSRSAIEYQIRQLKASEKIERVGGDNGGYWKVSD